MREWDAMSGAPTEVSVDQQDMDEDEVSTSKRANLGLLDADAVAHLATFLPLRSLLAASCVCTDWRRTFAACVESFCVSNVSLGQVPLEHALAQLARRFPSVTSLRLRGPTVMDAQVLAAARLNPSLTSLDLSQCDNVTDEAMAMLSLETPGLRALNVLGCRDITNDGVRRLARGCVCLTSLCLGWCDLSDNALLVLSKQCTLLEQLDVSGCGRLSDAGVTAVVSGCRRLTSLSIEGCREVSAWAVAAGSAPLTSLSMGGCTLVTDAGVGAIAAAHPGLRSLSLRLCRSVGDVALRYLAMRCSELTSLDISRCGSVTDVGISMIAAACPLLRDIDLEGYSDITDCALYALAQGCRQLEALNLWVCSQVSTHGGRSPARQAASKCTAARGAHAHQALWLIAHAPLGQQLLHWAASRPALCLPPCSVALSAGLRCRHSNDCVRLPQPALARCQVSAAHGRARHPHLSGPLGRRLPGNPRLSRHTPPLGAAQAVLQGVWPVDHGDRRALPEHARPLSRARRPYLGQRHHRPRAQLPPAAHPRLGLVRHH